MAGFRPVQLFNLAVPADGEPVPGLVADEFPATFRITMAAIDPTAPPEKDELVNGTPHFQGSTLRIIRVPDDDDDEDDDDEDSFDMAQLLDQEDSDGDSDEEDEDDEMNGGPSDPSKSPKAKRQAALKEAIANAMDEDKVAEVNGGKTLSAKQKGKAQALEDLELDGSDEDSDMSVEGAEEFVLCTLDPAKQYQQTLDITVSEHETVYFRSTGTHTIFLTGNVLIPEILAQRQDMYDSDSEDDFEDEGYDLPPDAAELDEYDDEDESDELDDLEDPRILEIGSDEDEEAAPKLTKAKQPVVAKGKNKRVASDSSDIDAADAKLSLDGLLDKSLKASSSGSVTVPEADKQLSKTQQKKMRKKMKDNAGNAVEISATAKPEDQGTSNIIEEQETTPSGKSDKKVQFAKKLVQGPSGSSQPNGDVAKAKAEKKDVEAPKINGDAAPNKPGKGPRVTQGVTIDDKKVGSGPAAKKGNKVSMRYIGKLDKDKKVFDSNKKGPPFRFTLGSGEVIKGWDIGLAGISVGGERRITIPASLGYGSKGTDGIPGNSTLIFDVKCLEIK